MSPFTALWGSLATAQGGGCRQSPGVSLRAEGRPGDLGRPRWLEFTEQGTVEKSAAQNCREHSSPCAPSRVLTRASMGENYLKLEKE